MDRLLVFGTGNATVTECYNTCFSLTDGKEFLLVDAGGGNGILGILKHMKVPVERMHHAFLSHRHTDHMLGMVWVIRLIGTMMTQDRYEGTFTVYCHRELAADLECLVRMTLDKRVVRLVGKRILVVPVEDGEEVDAGPYRLTCFDIHSDKTRQFGFSTLLNGGGRLVFLGDEPYRDACEPYVRGARWLLIEAFCLHSQADVFKPYEKYHSTVKDACELAERMNIPNLLLWHTEDSNLACRRSLYSREGRMYYSGNLVIPDDADIIDL